MWSLSLSLLLFVHSITIRNVIKKQRQFRGRKFIFLAFTCSFDDLPDGCRRGWHHGSLIQTQFADIHDVEAIHVLLWSDGVTHGSLVDVL